MLPSLRDTDHLFLRPKQSSGMSTLKQFVLPAWSFHPTVAWLLLLAGKDRGIHTERYE